MSRFAAELARRQPPAGGSRRWVFAANDQLTDRIGPLAAQPPSATGLVLVESHAAFSQRPYHRQKLALLLANQRHFALEQAARGVAVVYLQGEAAIADQLAAYLASRPGPLVMMEAAERELRVALAPLVASGRLTVVPHAGWLTTTAQFAQAGGPPWRMDAFYRVARRATGLLMAGDQPRGGRWSFDPENRRPWKGDPPAPSVPVFTPDAITREAGALVAERYADHPGTLDLTALPATAADAASLWAWAKAECLPQFGPFEDAMCRRHSSLFHSRCAHLINLHRLLPAELVHDIAAADLPLASQEGFIRQILGWREYVRHVHVATDGFRTVPGNVFGGTAELPPAYWGTPSGLACLDRVVADVWREGYSHHITRLMVLANLATLLEVDPRQTTDWFWVAYTDAYDWVVEPNVLGMGTGSLGGLMTTKPYLGGGAYLSRMGDYCRDCRFDPKHDCPFTTLYWDWFRRHGAAVAGNPRMTTIVHAHAQRGAARHAADQRRAAAIGGQLAAGAILTPEGLP